MTEMPTRNVENRYGVNSLEVVASEEVSFLGEGWSLLPSVYPMYRFRSTAFFWESLRELGPFDRLLEVGCGAGVISVLAARSGVCRQVTAVDINPNAVANTELNARRHGVKDRVRVAESDLFGSVSDNERFDLVFWNSNGVLVEDGADLSDHERSFFDPGYVLHGRYFSEGPDYLADSGRLLLGFCGGGDRDLLERKGAESGVSMIVLAEDLDGSHPHWLLEFTCTT